MDEYPIVTIQEAMVDGHRCVSDEEDDRMKYGLENTLFEAWRNMMWRMISLYKVLPLSLYKWIFVPGVVWSTHARLNLVDFAACWISLQESFS